MRRTARCAALSFLVVGLLAPRAHAVIITTAKGQGADAYIRSGAYDDATHGAESTLILKNRGGNTQNYSRKAYVRFDLSGLDLSAVTGATLNAVVNSANLPSDSSVNVFALNDLDTGESWGESTIIWNNAPANSINSGAGVDGGRTSDLGDMIVPGTATGGTPISFASAALTQAVQDDTNGALTLILTRVSTHNSSVSPASKENTTYPGPALELAGAGMTWDGGGGADQTWSQGLNWSGDASPGPGDHCTFTDTAAASSAGTVTNVVTTDFTIASLHYEQFVQNAKYHTAQIDAGATLKVTDELEVNDDLTVPPSGYTSTVHTTMTGGGTFQVGNTGESTATILMGYNPGGGDVDTGILDLSGLATFTAHLDRMDLGTGGAPAVGNLTLAATSTVNANAVVIGENAGTGIVTAPSGATVAFDVGALSIGVRDVDPGGTTSGTLDLTNAASVAIDADTIALGNIVGGNTQPTTGTIHFGASNTVAADTFVVGANKGTGVVDIAAGGTLSLGTSGDRGDLRVGYKDISSSRPSTGTVDLSAGATFNAWCDDLVVGGMTPAAGGTGATGTLDLAASNTIYANRFLIGHTDGNTSSSASSTGTVTLPTGGTLTLGSTSDRGDLFVGTKTASVAAKANGTLDLTGGTFNAWLDELVVGYNSAGNTLLNTQGSLTLGTANTVIANTFAIGDTKGTGTVSITPGGTLTLGSESERADLLVGHNSLGSSYGSTGTLDLSDGTFNAWLDELAIGRSLSGTGPPTGTVTLGTSNAVDVNTIAMGVRAPDTGTLSMSGGTVTVNGDVAGGAGSSTLNVLGGTMSITGNLTVDSLLIADDAKSATVTVGGTAQIGGSGTLTIARRPNTINGNMTGTLDLSGTTSVSISTDTLTLGDNYAGSTSNTVGVLHLGPDNTITSPTVYVGRRKGTGTVDIVSGGTLNLGTSADPADLFIGYNDINTSKDPAQSHANLSNGTLVAFLDELIIGYKGAGSSNGRGNGKLTLGTSSANAVHANAVTLGDYQASGNDYASGTIEMNRGAFDVAGDVLRGAGGTQSRSTVRVNGGTMTIAGDVKVDELRVGGNNRTGTLNLTGANVQIGDPADTTNLYVGRRTGGTSSATNGTLALTTPGATLEAYCGDLFVGSMSSGAGGGGQTVAGTLDLSQTASATLHAPAITLGDVLSGSTAKCTGTLLLGANTTLDTAALYVAYNKGTGVLNFGTAGTPTLTLGSSGSPADLFVGLNPGDTSTTSTGTMDLSGGTFVGHLDELVVGSYGGTTNKGSAIGTLTLGSSAGNDVNANSVLLGHHASTGTGKGEGRINLGGGSLTTDAMALGTGSSRSTGIFHMTGGAATVNGDVTDGPGRSEVRVYGGSMTVNGDLTADRLLAGANAGTGIVTVNGGAVNIGAAYHLYAGRRSSGSGATDGTIDFTNATSVDIALGSNDLLIGTDNTGSGTTRGSLLLSPSNTIDAASIMIGDSNPSGSMGVTSILSLGLANTITTNLLTVGGRKSLADMSFAAGGTLALTGRGTGGLADLRVGYNSASGTGTHGVGVMDLRGGIFNADLDQVVLGYHHNGVGSGTGTLYMDAGQMTANTIVLGDTNNNTATGTIHFSGGTISAGSIDGGGGSANFNWTGGTLHVDSFGFTLLNDDPASPGAGTGTLAPGRSIGTTEIFGDYTQGAAATLEIEIEGTDCDLVVVHGEADLAGYLDALLTNPVIGTIYDVLIAEDGIPTPDLTFRYPGDVYMYYDVVPYEPLLGDFPDAEVLRLHYTPEPATMTLLLLGAAPLALRRRKQRRTR